MEIYGGIEESQGRVEDGFLFFDEKFVFLLFGDEIKLLKGVIKKVLQIKLKYLQDIYVEFFNYYLEGWM